LIFVGDHIGVARFVLELDLPGRDLGYDRAIALERQFILTFGGAKLIVPGLELFPGNRGAIIKTHYMRLIPREPRLAAQVREQQGLRGSALHQGAFLRCLLREMHSPKNRRPAEVQPVSAAFEMAEIFLCGGSFLVTHKISACMQRCGSRLSG
jgi:hypothetical protein